MCVCSFGCGTFRRGLFLGSDLKQWWEEQNRGASPGIPLQALEPWALRGSPQTLQAAHGQGVLYYYDHRFDHAVLPSGREALEAREWDS